MKKKNNSKNIKGFNAAAITPSNAQKWLEVEERFKGDRSISFGGTVIPLAKEMGISSNADLSSTFGITGKQVSQAKNGRGLGLEKQQIDNFFRITNARAQQVLDR